MQAMHLPIDNVQPIRHNRREDDRYWELALNHLADQSEAIQKLADKLDSHVEKSAERHEAMGAKITGSDAVIAAILEGFPNKDPRGHHDAHTEWIESARRRKEFWSKLLAEVTKYGLIGLLGWLLTLAWHGLLKGPAK